VVESSEIVFTGALSIHLFRHFCCSMYRLVTMRGVTDRRTERRQYDDNSRSQCAIVVRSVNNVTAIISQVARQAVNDGAEITEYGITT